MAKLSRNNIREPKVPKGWHVESAYPCHGTVAHIDPIWVRDGYHLEACNGDAHSNPHIDHCARCMPRWGFIAVPDVAEHPRGEEGQDKET